MGYCKTLPVWAAWSLMTSSAPAHGAPSDLLATWEVGTVHGSQEIYESRWPALAYLLDGNELRAPLFEGFALTGPFPVTIDDTVSAVNDVDFDGFVELLTDGLNEEIVVLQWGASGPGAGGGGGEEMFELNFLAPRFGADLIGYNIDHITQHLSVDIQSPGSDPFGDGMWTDWSVTGRYEFWGAPIPEPCTLLLLLGGALTLARRRRRGDCEGRNGHVGYCKTLTVLAAWSLMTSSAPARGAQSELLATLDVGLGVGSAEIYESRWPALVYLIGNDDFRAPLFEDFALSPPFPVTVNDTVSAQDDADFEAFVELLTDGLNEPILVLQWTASGPGSGGGGGDELFDLYFAVPRLGPDLVGYSVDHITQILTVDQQSPGSDPYGDGIWTDWSVAGHYEFYGAPIPEPTSALILGSGLGVAVLLTKRRSRPYPGGDPAESSQMSGRGNSTSGAGPRYCLLLTMIGTVLVAGALGTRQALGQCETGDTIPVDGLGGGEPVTVLAPNTRYELHYEVGCEQVNFYILGAIATTAEEGLAEVVSPAAGNWSTTGNFVYYDVLVEYGELICAPDYPDGFYRTDWAHDGFFPLPSDGRMSAGGQGHLCDFATGCAGELRLQLYVAWINRDAYVDIEAQAEVAFSVGAPTDDPGS